MSAHTRSLEFRENLGLDPAATGDPFVRVRFRHGMLLGAEDLTLEQRSHLLRHRLHQALLHGAGTVWGLGARSRLVGDRQELEVSAGLAIDALGREIFVPKALCLDLSTLSTAHWSALSPIPATRLRRGYIVLRHVAAESEPVPAIRPPGASEAESMAYSRVCDRYRVDLEAEAPPDPGELLLGWLGREGSTVETGAVASLRDALIAWITAPASALSRLWDPEEEKDREAPLLLATVELSAETGPGEQVRLTGAQVDNRPRPICPTLPLILEQVLGQRLGGPDAGVRCRVRSIGVSRQAGALGVDVLLTAPVESRTVGGARLLALGAQGWSRLSATAAVSGSGSALRLSPSEPLAEGSCVQVLLPGQGEAPLLGAGGQPLGGWWDDPLPAPGRGLDVSWVGQWAEVES